MGSRSKYGYQLPINKTWSHDVRKRSVGKPLKLKKVYLHNGKWKRCNVELETKEDRNLLNCKAKAAKGNVFENLDYADAYAKNLQKKIRAQGQRARVRAYLCNVCNKYHVGGDHGKQSRSQFKKWLKEAYKRKR